MISNQIPISDYRFESIDTYTCRIRMSIQSGVDRNLIDFSNLPQPDQHGVFLIDDQQRVVPPTADHAHLSRAKIRCVGEQLYDFFKPRMQNSPSNWSPSEIRKELPIEEIMIQFFIENAQILRQTNWLDRQTHLRRIIRLERDRIFTPDQFGLTCPYEMPEGPNVGKIFTIAIGAEIRDGKLIKTEKPLQNLRRSNSSAISFSNSNDENRSAGSALGLSAATIPFANHTDANRVLMGANMMRQWYTPIDPEPALVQTGFEPTDPEFWCGRNVLTAYTSCRKDTFEDAIVIGRSCADRFDFPYSVEPGDKFSNRHGTKGVICKIYDDHDMPKLADGTPIELVYSFAGIPTRMNFGQMREAIFGRIAKAIGSPIIVPPFTKISRRAIRSHLKKYGLPENGREILTIDENGTKTDQPVLVGYVYWGCLLHIAREKFTFADRTAKTGQLLANNEYEIWRDLGLNENLIERFHTLNAQKNVTGFDRLRDQLKKVGIAIDLDSGKISFKFADLEGKTIRLARSISHPWLRSRQISEAPMTDEIAFTNDRLQRTISHNTPAILTDRIVNQLEHYVREAFDNLVSPNLLQFSSRSIFSGRSVIVSGGDERFDQIGIPNEMAWAFFGDRVADQVGDEAVANRSDEAKTVLDQVMSESWVIAYRAPATIGPTSSLAFHPVRCDDRAIHLSPMACALMNADFDGDQVAIFCPRSENAQIEASEKLSISAHLKRDSDLIEVLTPPIEVMWGIASHGFREPQAIEDLIGFAIDKDSDRLITKSELIRSMKIVLDRDGADRTLEILEELYELGFSEAKRSGASINPFLGESFKRPPAPIDDNFKKWRNYSAEISEQILSRRDYDDPDFGTLLLLLKSGGRSNDRALTQLLGPWLSRDFNGEPIVIKNGYCDGITIDDLKLTIHNNFDALLSVAKDWERYWFGRKDRLDGLEGYLVLARAMRSDCPGVVFAHAAEIGEIEPFEEINVRFFVGVID